MSEACAILHQWANRLPRYNAGNFEGRIPGNGIYLVFEAGERAHGCDRIVRVGTHTGNDNLAKRINEHLFTQNKDRSIFRKHIGRCLLADDPFLDQWNLDLTTKANKQKYGATIDTRRQAEVENHISDYISRNLEFVAFPINEKKERLEIEKSLLATISSCADCSPSADWLGLKHQTAIIREGLWNVQGFGGRPLTAKEIIDLVKRVAG